MDPDFNKFGKGPRELIGAVDLASHYKLLPHYDFFWKKPHPVSISDSHYLHNVVGDTEIRKGEGMQLGQLIQDISSFRDTKTRLQPFDIDILREAFLLRDTTRVDLSSSDKGTSTIPGKSKNESKDKEKHKKHKDKEKEKDKEHKKQKHRHKDRSKDKEEKKKDKTAHHDSCNDHSIRHHEKRRKQEGDEENDIHKHKKSKRRKQEGDEENDIHKHKKSKHKSSKIDETGVVKAAG